MSMRQTKSSADAGEQAARWHARLMSGEMTQADRAALRRWLHASDGNRAAFTEIEEALEMADCAAPQALEREYEDDLDALALAQHLPTRRVALIAATFFAAVVAAAAVLYSPFSDGATRVLTTDVGEARKVPLADGSIVELNTATRVRIDFDRRERAVEVLNGEALFDVVRDRDRPFVVTARQATVTVTGTVFDVSAIGGEAAIHVLSGAVEVQPLRDSTIALLPGESVAINAEGRAGEVERFEPGRLLAWRRGKMRFDNTPISAAVAEMNRYYRTPIELDAAVADSPVTGEFDIADQNAAVRALAAAFSLDVERRPDRILLTQSRK